MADKALWLAESDVRELATLEDAIEILAQAYGPESQAGAQNMHRAHARHGDTILHAVGGMLTGQGVAGTKSWIYSPAGASPLLVVFSLEDGRLLGLVEAFTLGQWRTAATSGLGTKLLAREDAHVLTLLGTGKQALTQAQAVAAVRDLRELRVFGRDRNRLADFAGRAAEIIDAELTTHTDLREALEGADIVTTITRAADPFLSAEMLACGMHINAVGAIVPSRSELTPDAVGACDIVVADSPEQARSDSGELRAAADAGLLDWSKVSGLTELLADSRLGRTNSTELTLFKALGIGLSDVALGAELLRRARHEGVGTRVPATTSHIALASPTRGVKAMPEIPDVPMGAPDPAVFIDRSGRHAPAYRPLNPVLIKSDEIEAEIERLAEGPFRGSRRVVIAHPGLLDSSSLYPAVSVSINVLLPGERTDPHRHNSSVVNFGVRGRGKSIIGGRTIEWGKYDTFSTPPWAIHQHINDTNEILVRLSYSNAGLLDRLGVHVLEETGNLDPNQPLGDPNAEREMSTRGETIGEDGAALLTYEQLISPEPPYQPALYWPFSELKLRLEKLKSLGQEYKGRRLCLMYDRTTGRSQGTTSTFFATITMRPAGIIDQPHRHTSAAVNYIFSGQGWSIVGGKRYEWGAGDLMLTAPGWMPHGHASHPGDDVYELTIQDSPLQIAIGSLLWVENLHEKAEALGVTKGFETNRETVQAGV